MPDNRSDPGAPRKRGPKPLDTGAFVAKARAVHGPRYGYDKSVYVGSRLKVIIHCPDHGDFEQTPSQHLTGSGCSKCGLAKRSAARRLTFERFVARARSEHGGKYRYDQAGYVDCRTPTVIFCPDHGEFQQTPDAHMAGHGCRKCGFALRAEKKKLSPAAFFARCQRLHKGRFTYPLQDYGGIFSEITVACPDHGEFKTVATYHLRMKRGCPECGRLGSAESQRMTFAEFLAQARAVQGDKFDYDEASFAGFAHKVRVRCRIHDWFEQAVANHLKGCGCTRCYHERQTGRWSVRTLSPEMAAEPCFLYYLRFDGGGERFYKIGIASDLSRRLSELGPSGYSTSLVWRKPATRRECMLEERAILDEHRPKHRYRPLMPFPGDGECFSSDVLGLDPQASPERIAPNVGDLPLFRNAG